MTLEAGQAAFLTLVRRYVERQRLTYAAMEQLRPDMLRYMQQSREDKKAAFKEYLESLPKFSAVPFTGYWGEHEEWAYFIHGMSCRLTHTVTGEPSDWDAPDVYCFDEWKFSRYLEWALKHNADDEVVSAVQATLSAYESILTDTLKHRYEDILKNFRTEQLVQLRDLGFLSDKGQFGYLLVQT
jgi:hypothetical protein